MVIAAMESNSGVEAFTWKAREAARRKAGVLEFPRTIPASASIEPIVVS